jgi:hypothetical protein
MGWKCYNMHFNNYGFEYYMVGQKNNEKFGKFV